MEKYSTIWRIFKILAILCVILAVIGLVAALIFKFPALRSMRIALGAAFVLFIPGFVWSYVFFDREKPLDLIERITLSFTLSMAMGPLLIFFLNKIGIKINLFNTAIELLILIIAGFLALYIQEKRVSHPKRSEGSY